MMPVEMPRNSSRNASLVSSPFADCLSPQTNAIIIALLVAYLFLTPLFLSVLVVGFRKWRKVRFSSPFASLSHIDVFTYNATVVELLGVLGMLCTYYGAISDTLDVLTAGLCIQSIISTGQMLFHLLTCIERYLAVVHPVVYLQLRGSAGVRMRNITIRCVWLVSLAVTWVSLQFKVPFEKVSFVLMLFTSVAFCFCSIVVLTALLHPGPGEGGKSRVCTDQSKQKAFQTMLIITGTLSLRFISTLIILILKNHAFYNQNLFCLVSWSPVWFYIPSSLVLPLLFLQRAGKLKVFR